MIRRLLVLAFLPCLVAADEIVERAVVPSAERPQGEVRIVRRDRQVVVQTMLRSKVLRRVAGEIAKKESRNWPDSEDAARYVDALRRAVDRVRAAPLEGDGQDRRRELEIEFFTEPEGGRVVILGAGSEEALDLSREYVARNMRLIVADAFGVSIERAGAMLEPR